eukprot:TRINITY_DN5307_c0_g2_i1.p1 TRINITY_DN5307_c0_g2~~TRINITY_DN5307_c0_g2_i1.p1  ORF type:complete len:246 (+),score=76.03 TRINITY_DN5307_c0_g2_i1:78-815(+)
MGPSMLTSLPVTLFAVAKAVAQSVFFMRDSKSGLTLSAIFLICFLVVHALGNLGILKGRDAMNTYGYLLVSNPAILFIEGYMLLMACIHLASAAYITLTTPAKRGAYSGLPTAWDWRSKTIVMGTTGSVLLAFIVVHLQDFRFGTVYPTTLETITENPYTGGPVEARDLYRLQLEVLSSEAHAFFYLVAVAAVWYHLSYGWSTAVRKLGIPSEHIPNATLIGNLLLCTICAAFSLAVVVSYLKLV